MNERPLRIVSYNVRYFGHALRGLASTLGPKRRIARALLALDPAPDLICLQEVETRSLRSRLAYKSAEKGQTQLEAFMGRMDEMAAELGTLNPYEAFYFRAHTYRLGPQSLYTTGLAVLVNRETLTVDSHNTEDPARITTQHVQRYRDRKQTRICAHMRLLDGAGRPFHVFNTHFSLPTLFAAEFWKGKDKMGFGENQLTQAKTLGTFVRERSGHEPYVVCGDFNSAPGSPVFQALTTELACSCAQVELSQVDPKNPRAFPTAGFMKLRMHLDHLFGRQVEWSDVAGTHRFGDPASPFYGLSDHMPLIARFHLRPSPRPVIPDVNVQDEVAPVV